MTSLVEREQRVQWIREAVMAGARLTLACAEAEISIRTFARWTKNGTIASDQRPQTVRATPSNALSDEERAAIIATANEPRFASLPPSQIVPRLADEGKYLASESSFYRVLKASDQQHHRGRAKAPQKRTITTHEASAPNQVWCWDITYLPAAIRGDYFYLYMVHDLYSRKIVGWEVHETESGDHASALIKRSYLSESIAHQNKTLVLHADNGAPMKAATLLSTLQFLGVASSHSRPRVSNDNAYVEALFRTCKYRPDYPAHGFANIDSARQWVSDFVYWYNTLHRHSGIRFVTPSQRHQQHDVAVLKKRHELYEAARSRHPERWSGSTRNWAPIKSVYLNPERNKETERQQAA
jgi:putative transposase